jgi:hypothetical protein
MKKVFVFAAAVLLLLLGYAPAMRVKEMKVFNSDSDELFVRWIYSYNPDGSINGFVSYEADGKKRGEAVYTYEESVIRQKSIPAGRGGETVYELDSKRNPVKRTDYHGDRIGFYFVYQYENGRIQKQISYSAADKITGETTYVYDTKGNITQSLDKDGNVLAEREYSKDGLLEKIVYPRGGSRNTFFYEEGIARKPGLLELQVP